VKNIDGYVGYDRKMIQSASLGEEEAQCAIAAISQAMHEQGRAGVIAVTDSHGELIGLLRVDGAPLSSIVIAYHKAWTATRERKPSAEVGRAARDPKTGFDIGYFGEPRYTGWGGGIPVIIDDRVVGAVAVSGLPTDEDIVFATIGVEAIVQSK
jgi:glc operon protein GlcG